MKPFPEYINGIGVMTRSIPTLSFRQRLIGAVTLLTASAVLLSACSYSHIELYEPDDYPAHQRPGESLKNLVDALVQPSIQSGESVGVVVAVVTPRANRYFSYGYSSLEAKKPMSADTIFGVGSVTKAFVSALLAEMVERGEVRYEETLGELAPPDLNISNPSLRSVNLRELVSHTSGLPREPRSWESLRSAIRFLVAGENLYNYVSKPALYELLAGYSAFNIHPAPYRYSNIGMGLLGFLLASRANGRFADLVRERICEPIGMTVCSFNPEELGSADLAAGYSGDQPFLMRRNKRIEAWRLDESMEAAGGLYTNARSLTRFLRGHLDPVSTRLSTALSSTRTIESDAGDEQVARGWFIRKTGVRQDRMFYQIGIFAGFTCFLGMNIEHQVGVIVLKNNFSWNEKIGARLLQRLLLTPAISA